MGGLTEGDGPAWAPVIGCLALVVAGVMSADSADYMGRTGADGFAYVAGVIVSALVGVLLIATATAWLKGRPIWPPPIWRWLVLAAGVVALVHAGLVAADHSNDAQEAHDLLHPTSSLSRP